MSQKQFAPGSALAPAQLRPWRGSRRHHEHNSQRHRAAARTMTLPACTDIEPVEIVTADDLCAHLARGSSLSASGGPSRLPVFHRQPGELPAGEGWQMLEPTASALETAATAESLDVLEISRSVQETAYALDRCEAAHLVALAETTLAAIAAEDGPDTLEVLLRSHGMHSARELISRHLPRTVVRAVLVDADLTKTGAHRRLVDAVFAYLGFSRCLALVIEGRLSMAKLRALLRASALLQLHDARWLGRDITGRVEAENSRNAEEVSTDTPASDSFGSPDAILADTNACNAGEGRNTDSDGYVRATSGFSVPDDSAGAAHIRDRHGRLHGPALLAAPLETFTQHVRAQAALCAPPAPPMKTVHDARRVTYERADSGSAFLTLEGPITTLEPYYQRLQATARAVRAGRLQPLVGTADDAMGRADVPHADSDARDEAAAAVPVDGRTLDQLMFDLAALAAPATYVPVELHAPGCIPHAAADPAGTGDCAGDATSRAGTEGLSPSAGGSTSAGRLPSVVEKRRIRLSNPAGGAPLDTFAVVHIPLQGTRVRAGTITEDHSPVIADSRRRRLAPPLPHRSAPSHRSALGFQGTAPPASGTDAHAPRDIPDAGTSTGEAFVPAATRTSMPAAMGTSMPAAMGASVPAAMAAGGAQETVFPPLVRVQCPAEGEWLSQQATVMVTVPVLSLVDAAAHVPADLTGVGPLPADAARQIVSTQSVLYRILTDPATGTVLDETAQTYTIPANVRRTVTSKHRQCAAPGCTRTALRCQTDHIVPFNHLLPAAGGLTVPENLQPLCQPCHQLKTQGILTVTKSAQGLSQWSGPLGRESVTLTAPDPYEIQAAARLRELLADTAERNLAERSNAAARNNVTSQNSTESQRSAGSRGSTGSQSEVDPPAVWVQDEAPPF